MRDGCMRSPSPRSLGGADVIGARDMLAAICLGLLARIAVHDRPLDPPPYRTLYFDQTLDHFAFGAAASTTWRQRYLLDDRHWKVGSGPILFYTGNEGPIDAFYAASGFVTDVLAPRLGGLVLFAEQRFYGHSLPFGAGSWSPTSLRYLTTEQVLADYAALLTALKPQLNASGLPVVAFGGSYGGTLSTFFRLKYPHVVVGALAASAPVGYYSPTFWGERGVTSTTWFETVVADYAGARADMDCHAALVRAVALANATARAPGGGAAVASAFNLCAPPAEVEPFVYWITEALESIPQVDYPYAVGTLPPSPVNATCAAIAAAAAAPAGVASAIPPLLSALGKVVSEWYYGGGSCTPQPLARNMQRDGGTPGDGPAPHESWGYQSCTENTHAFSVVKGSWREYAYDGAGSNIIWSNGRRDPWHGGGFLRASDALDGGAVFVMKDTAHHQDLRLPHPADPDELVAVRKEEERIIRGWVGLD